MQWWVVEWGCEKPLVSIMLDMEERPCWMAAEDENGDFDRRWWEAI